MVENKVKSVEKTFEIVRTIQELDGASLTTLSREMGIPQSTAHNYLKSLEEAEYLTEDDGTYHIGIRFLEHGAYARARKRVYETAKPEVDKLAEETGELANLLIEEHGRGSYLRRARGEDAVQVKAHVGTRVYLHSTALGKAILANLPAERCEEILDRHGLPEQTARTTTDRDKLYEELETIRERGYAYDDEERLEGLRCVAAPIQSNSDRVLGAISIAGPTKRLRDDAFHEKLPTKLLEAVNVIELNITYS
ncbi:IclR family transcriptional regulator [Haloarcula nitratireducens]|uniref:IclR family transcriptional regulator n=1 Tax=Haloarcula nitratireducens TaxID=2487749 RepID=A0AAW4PHW2_9EURY|nr:IclR family transcriptional regulator [Halomicroarcula nitratireducens]MBX0297025.1 IclR family transcriptional regulator [Halomicroarcula nitratireducens]